MKKRYGICEYIRWNNGSFEKAYEVYDRIEKDRGGEEVIICKCDTRSLARKVARALNEVNEADAMLAEREK